MKPTQNYINHIAFLLDASSSINHLTKEIIDVFDAQIQHLAQRSKETNQETRVSVYTFNSQVECLIFDKDVLRFPSIREYYSPNGQTALIDATLKSINDFEKTPTLYGDSSYLIIALTDGANNINNHLGANLSQKIKSLPENWTIAVMVPDAVGVSEAKKFGFSQGNIQIWDVSKKGIESASKTLNTVTDNYMTARASGVRGTKTLFQINTSNLNSETVLKKLDQISASDYDVLVVRKDGEAIQTFVESWGHVYRKGSAYYELTKPERIQGNKQILVQNKISGKVYGGDESRRLLGLPDYEVGVEPTHFQNYRVFVNSTSVNRKLVKGTNLIYFK